MAYLTDVRLMMSVRASSEFEDTMLEDLTLMGVHGERVTHPSDYLLYLYEQWIKLPTMGKAYADDTEQQQAMIPVFCLF